MVTGRIKVMVERSEKSKQVAAAAAAAASMIWDVNKRWLKQNEQDKYFLYLPLKWPFQNIFIYLFITKCSYTFAIISHKYKTKIRNNPEYLKNLLHDLHVIQKGSGQLIAYPWRYSPIGLLSRQWNSIDIVYCVSHSLQISIKLFLKFLYLSAETIRIIEKSFKDDPKIKFCIDTFFLAMDLLKAIQILEVLQ